MSNVQRVLLSRLITVVAFAALACDGDDTSGPANSIQVAVSPATLTLPQGGTGSLSVQLTRGGGFSGAVTITVAGLPVGVTATVTPAELTGSVLTASIDVAIDGSATPGAHALTITAAAAGVTQAMATHSLTISESRFALSFTVPGLTIVPGGSNSATVNINRIDFAGDVSLQLVNPPAGITGTFTPTPTGSLSSGLEVAVAPTVAPGNYAITVRGVSGSRSYDAPPLTITVPGPPAGGNVAFDFCSPDDIPAFFAYQDGNQAWQAVNGTVAGNTTSYILNLTQGRGGVMLVYSYDASAAVRARRSGRHPLQREAITPSLARRLPSSVMRRHGELASGPTVLQALGEVYETVVLYGTTAQLAQEGVDACIQSSPTRTVSGTVTGVQAGEYGIVSLGGITRIFDAAAPVDPLIFSDVPGGVVDLFGSHAIPGAAPRRLIVMRNLDVPDGGTLPAPINFQGASSSVPATASVIVTGGGSDRLEVFTDLVTANSIGGLWFDLSPSQVSTRTWAGLGTTAMQPGDFHTLVVFASPGGSDDFRFVLRHVGPVANQALELAPAIDIPDATEVAAGAYPRFRFEGALPAAYNRGATIDVFSEDGSGNTFSILATGAYLAAVGNQQAYDLTIPDVDGLAGFPVASRLSPGTNGVVASAFGFTGPGIFVWQPVLGSEARSSVRNFSIIVP